MILAWQRILYREGWYQFRPSFVFPPKDEDAWIRFIDSTNGWLPNGGKRPYLMPRWLRELGVELHDAQFYDAGTKT